MWMIEATVTPAAAARVGVAILVSACCIPLNLRAQQAVPVATGAAFYVPVGQMIDWDAATYGDPAVFVIDGYQLRLSSRKMGTDPALPILDVTAPTGEKYEIDGQEGFDDARASFGVGKLDPDNPGDQVIFTTFSGGAHCCTRIDILELSGGHWENAAVHDGGRFFDSVDGDGLGEFPVDVDGNGVPDFWLRGRQLQLRVRLLCLRLGSAEILRTPSRQSRGCFGIASLRAHVPGGHGDGARVMSETYGGCAGFAADAARLGRLDEVWPVVLQNYDPHNHNLPTPECEVAHNCPANFKPMEFPEALKLFLTEHGYLKSNR